MRRQSRYSTVIALIVIAALAAPVFAAKWVKLGERTVTDRMDIDKIKVGVDEGAFSRIQLSASGGPVRVRRINVVFENGGEQSFDRNYIVARGGRGPVHKLQGAERHIKRVELFYDEASRKRQRTEIRVWARR